MTPPEMDLKSVFIDVTKDPKCLTKPSAVRLGQVDQDLSGRNGNGKNIEEWPKV